MYHRTSHVSGLVLALSLAVAACGGGQPEPLPPPSAPEPVPSPAPASPPPVAAVTPEEPAPQWPIPDTNPQPGEGRDFKPELDLLNRVVTCAGDAELPKQMAGAALDKHCARVEFLIKYYHDNYVSKAKPFFEEIRPEQLPPTVVYPFGGGDLLSALLVYPDGLEITTISLEFAGDPRKLTKQTNKAALEKGLKLMGDSFHTLLRGDWNWTRNMEALQKAGMPEQLGYALVALKVHDYQPLSLRYFRFRGDGSIDYLDDAEIESLADKRPEQLRKWGTPDYSKAFSNAEIRFQKGSSGPVKVFRHVAANLMNKRLMEHHAALMLHLDQKGDVSALTRAAAHLMWKDEFSLIRDYLAKHLVWMPSDSTGIPPKYAAQAGLVQEVYGTFEGMYEPSDQDDRPKEHDDAFKKLFKEKSTRKLDFLFGYSDNRRVDAESERIGHVVVTRRPDAK